MKTYTCWIETTVEAETLEEARSELQGYLNNGNCPADDAGDWLIAPVGERMGTASADENLDSLAIVYDLANENALSERYANDEVLAEEYEKQQRALAVVLDIIEEARAMKKELDEDEELEIGDSVLVPDPTPGHNEAWEHEFEGTIKDFRYDVDTDETLAVVEDMDGECFDVEVSRLKRS